jgi:phosphoserine phosphatase
MSVNVTLLANAATLPLNDAFVQSMVLSLAAQGVNVIRHEWLASEVAARLELDAPESPSLRATVAAIMADQPYDAIVRPADAPALKLLISDMDSTMITVECIDELADFVGKKTQVAEITERAMNGELDFAAALTERVALLADLPQSALEECYMERVKMMPGAQELLDAANARGMRCVLVSGGFTFFTARVRDQLGFHADFSNQLEIQYGLLTGRVIPPILGKEAKLATLKAECAALSIGSAQVLAIGDGANDLPMLMEAGLGVAYHAKPVVRAQANAALNHTDLSALVYLL